MRRAVLALTRPLTGRGFQPCTSQTLPSSSRALASSSTDDSSDSLRRELNALLYRARQRGVLELDIIVGRWADANVDKLDADGRRQLAEVLKVETPDLLAALLKQGPAPAGLEHNATYAALAASVADRLARASAKTDKGAKWVNAWADLKEGGNQ